jgi:hypothetical protein
MPAWPSLAWYLQHEPLHSCRYGYVSFATKEAADLAISTFDDQLQLQGSGSSLSVYYAKKQHDSNAAPVQDKESCPARNAKLYFCGTPSSFRRDSILALFSAFGRVRHLQVYTDSFGVLASGTVTMYSTEEATAAMNSLDGKVLQPGTAPLKVGAVGSQGGCWVHLQDRSSCLGQQRCSSRQRPLQQQR